MNTLIAITAEELTLCPESLEESILSGLSKNLEVGREIIMAALHYLDELAGYHPLHNHIRDGKVGLVYIIESMIKQYPDGRFEEPQLLVNKIGLEQRCLSLKHIQLDDDLVKASRCADMLRAVCARDLIFINTDPTRQKKYNAVTDFIVGITSESRGKTTVVIPAKTRTRSDRKTDPESLKGLEGDFEGVIDESFSKVTDIHGTKGIVGKIVDDKEL